MSALKWVLIAGGGYLLLTRTNLLCSVGIGASCGAPATPQPTTGGPQPGATPGVTPAPVAPGPPQVSPTAVAAASGGGYMSLAAILSRLKAACAANNVPMVQGDYSATPWGFNWWLNQVSGIDLGPVMGTVFAGCGTNPNAGCDVTPISLMQFWSNVAPYLQQSKGLSGVGLARLAAALRGAGCASGPFTGRYGCFPTERSFALAVVRQDSAGA